MGEGNCVWFWEDDWLPVGPLSLFFPQFFRLGVNKEVLVKENYVGEVGFVSWVVPLKRILGQTKMFEFWSMLSLLANIFIYRGEADRRIWKPDPYSVIYSKSLLQGTGGDIERKVL